MIAMSVIFTFEIDIMSVISMCSPMTYTKLTVRVISFEVSDIESISIAYNTTDAWILRIIRKRKCISLESAIFHAYFSEAIFIFRSCMRIFVVYYGEVCVSLFCIARSCKYAYLLCIVILSLQYAKFPHESNLQLEYPVSCQNQQGFSAGNLRAPQSSLKEF